MTEPVNGVEVSAAGRPTPASAQLVSVNIGAMREVEHQGRLVTTGIFKSPTTEPQRVAGVHIGDDVQADTAAHGGVDKAIYAYATEDYEWWEAELDRSLEAGFFGENLTTRGIDVTQANIGDRWAIGSVVLEVSEPRVPCFKLGIRSGISRFQQAFSRAGRPGTYLRILEPGELVVGDTVTIREGAEPSVTVGEIAGIYHDHDADARHLLDVAALSEPWKRWARERTRG